MHCTVSLLLPAVQALSASGNIPPGPSLSVMVLTSGSWPTQPGAHCQLPKELNAICERFRNHYLGAHTGRRLQRGKSTWGLLTSRLCLRTASPSSTSPLTA